MEEDKIQDLANLNREAQAIWNQNADFWDERMGEGNQSQRLVTGPASGRLLDLRAGEWVLEIACGNGVFTRRMAQLGACVAESGGVWRDEGVQQLREIEQEDASE